MSAPKRVIVAAMKLSDLIAVAAATFLGTLPMLAIAIWTRIELKKIRKERNVHQNPTN
jgi:hypothetical protein